MRTVSIAVVASCLVAVTGCGSDGAPAAPVSLAERSYDGPLFVPAADAKHPRAGAAGDVVDCTTFGQGGTSVPGIYREGATADSPEEALATARGERGYGGVQTDLAIEKQEADRALFVVRVDGVVKQAVIVHNGPATTGAGGPGWYVESWAHCDYSELPRSFTDSVGFQAWTDADGEPVPSTTIQSHTGPEHCDWQSMIFLDVARSTFVRDPLPALEDYFDAEFEEHASLPAEVSDTGFERNGKHLWISSDRQRAYVGTADDVEVWPRTVKPLGCA